MDKFYKLSLIGVAGVFAYLMFNISFALFVPVSMPGTPERYDSLELVQAFKETYPAHGMTSSDADAHRISYTSFKDDILVELAIFPYEDDRMELNCHDLSDHDDLGMFYSVSSPSVDDIISSVAYCNPDWRQRG